MRLEFVELNHLEREFMRRGQYDGRSNARQKRLFPACNAQAPAIACLQSGKIEFRSRCHQIITERTAKLKFPSISPVFG